jgi:NADH-quinone oxidoreductase subunit H
MMTLNIAFVSKLLIIPIFFGIFVSLFALFAVYAERKISARVQNRIGPNRVGPYGLLQTIADILKLIQKEAPYPFGSDKIFFNLAPILSFAASFVIFSVLPFNYYLCGIDLNLGLIFIIAIGGFNVISILFAGWSSNNKYSLLGSMRSASQMISYEIPIALIFAAVFIAFNSLNTIDITKAQENYFFNWNIFGGDNHLLKRILIIPFSAISVIILFIAFLAEANRTPFDIPEAESELVAGFHTEYSGIKFSFFFLAEYSNMFIAAALISIIFLGGFSSPFGYIGSLLNSNFIINIEQFFWFTIKSLSIVFLQMMVRWTLPRLRADQLMNLCWKYLIPYSLVAVFYALIISYI